MIHPEVYHSKRDQNEYISPRSNVLQIPSLLWNGGYCWKVPFSGRGDPEPRVVTIKREKTKGPDSIRVQVVDVDGFPIVTSPRNGYEGTYITRPYTLLIYHLKDASGSAPRERNGKQLPLIEGTYVVEGHSTPAFWKLSNRNGSMPRKDKCFSIVAPNRSLDLAVDTVEEANQWRNIFNILQIPVKNGKDIKSILLFKDDNNVSAKLMQSSPVLPISVKASPRPQPALPLGGTTIGNDYRHILIMLCLLLVLTIFYTYFLLCMLQVRLSRRGHRSSPPRRLRPPRWTG